MDRRSGCAGGSLQGNRIIVYDTWNKTAVRLLVNVIMYMPFWFLILYLLWTAMLIRSGLSGGAVAEDFYGTTGFETDKLLKLFLDEYLYKIYTESADVLIKEGK